MYRYCLTSSIFYIYSEMPFGQIPILRIKRADKEDKGEELAQTLAIAQYLARKYGMY